MAKKPPIVSQELWDNIKGCTSRTPRRYLRLGYSRNLGTEIEEDERRMTAIMTSLGSASSEKDGNVRMMTMLREVRRLAMKDEKLSTRVERASGRTFACDYAYLLNVTRKHYANVTSVEDFCPAYAYAPKLRRDLCLFETNVAEAQWLTSSWSCLAFTETVGEGESCFRLCAYDDYCAGQVSCAQADFDLTMCALGVCMPEKIAALY